MKKSLVLAMAMALGVTASAYAANPFSDVPAGHWAYGSIEKLAAAGVVDGYGDTTFGGDKLMTRYEMAQIVAKAMAKGANVDKLAAEFADELDTLGVRVANLEKKADNVKITGQVRARYQSHDGHALVLDDGRLKAKAHKDGRVKAKSHKADLRTRLFVNGQINDDWSYTGLLQSVQNISDAAGNDDIDLNRAYVDGKIGGMAFRGGRWDEVTFTGNVFDSYIDGAKVAYGDKVKLFAIAGKGAAAHDAVEYMLESEDRVYVVGAQVKLGAVDAYLGYFKTDTVDNGILGTDNDGVHYNYNDKEIWNLGLSYGFGDFTLAAEYMRGDKEYADGGKDGWAADLAWKGADAAKPGSYGLHVGYFDQSSNAYISPTTDATSWDDGYKGFAVGASYTFAKNIVGVVNYYDMEAQTIDEDDKSIFTEVYFTF